MKAVPPRLYGGTERIVSYLTDGLVELGHDVTLFSSGDAKDDGELVPCRDRALRLDPEAAEVADRRAPFDAGRSPAPRRTTSISFIFISAISCIFPFFEHMPERTVTTPHGRLDYAIWPAPIGAGRAFR